VAVEVVPNEFKATACLKTTIYACLCQFLIRISITPSLDPPTSSLIFTSKMASINGKLEVEVEVKAHADKFWASIRDSPTILPKAFPNDYKSIEILEGDGKSVGTVRLITYGEGKYLGDSLLSYICQANYFDSTFSVLGHALHIHFCTLLFFVFFQVLLLSKYQRRRLRLLMKEKGHFLSV
jgi:hypothetical protein